MLMLTVYLLPHGGLLLAFQIPWRFAGCPPGRLDAISKYRPYWKSRATSSGSRRDAKRSTRTSVGCSRTAGCCSRSRSPGGSPAARRAGSTRSASTARTGKAERPARDPAGTRSAPPARRWAAPARRVVARVPDPLEVRRLPAGPARRDQQVPPVLEKQSDQLGIPQGREALHPHVGGLLPHGGLLLAFQIPWRFAGCPPGRLDAISKYRPYWKSRATSSGSRRDAKRSTRTSVGCSRTAGCCSRSRSPGGSPAARRAGSTRS